MTAAVIALAVMGSALAGMSAWLAHCAIRSSREILDALVGKRDAEDRFRAEKQRAEDALASLETERKSGDLLRVRVSALEEELANARKDSIANSHGADLVDAGRRVLSTTLP